MRKKTDFISIGYINGVHGLKGELRIKSTTDYPSRFKSLQSVYIETQQGERVEYHIEGVRIHGEKILLKLAGIETREESQGLRGSHITIKREDCLQLPEDHYYIFDLIDLEVKTTDGQCLGRVSDVLNLPANDVWVIQDGKREILIPAIQEVVKEVDLERGEVIINPIEGLLDEGV